MTSGGASGARRRQQRRRKAEEKRPLEVGEDLDMLKTHLSFSCLSKHCRCLTVYQELFAERVHQTKCPSGCSLVFSPNNGRLRCRSTRFAPQVSTLLTSEDRQDRRQGAPEALGLLPPPRRDINEEIPPIRLVESTRLLPQEKQVLQTYEIYGKLSKSPSKKPNKAKHV